MGLVEVVPLPRVSLFGTPHFLSFFVRKEARSSENRRVSVVQLWSFLFPHVLCPTTFGENCVLGGTV